MRNVHATVAIATTAILSGVLGLAGIAAQTPAAPAAPPSVDALIADGLKKAKAENKSVFVEFGASWCGPCQKLQAFLDEPQVRPIINRHFVVVPVTIWERGRDTAKNNPGGDELIKKWGGRAIPFYAFLGPAGAPLRDSREVGFPERNEDIKTFLDLLGKSAPALSASDRTVLAERLTNAAPAMGWNVTSAHRIWTEGDFTYRPTVSSDGRFIVMADYGVLMVHDLLTNVDRPFALPASAKDGADGDVYDQPVLSKDGRLLAVSYVDWKADRRDLRIVPIDATAVPEKPLFTDPTVDWIRPHDWTSDGKWILVELKRGNAGEIGMVSAADGAYKLLKRVGMDEIADDANYTGSDDTNLMLSPDDKYIVYDLFRKNDSDNRDVFVMRLSDGKESPAVVHEGDDGAFGWTRDGANLFFVSNRTGEYGLWVASFRDGAFGVPTLVRPDLGEVTPMGVQPNGSLIYAPSDVAGRDVWTFGMDFSAGVITSPLREYATDAIGHNSSPSWSPDGTEVLYRSARGGRTFLVAKSAATGAVRIIPDAPPGGIAAWAPDGKSFVVTGGGGVVRRVDLKTGETAELLKDVRALRMWTADGRLLFERAIPGAGPDPQTAIVERDIASGKEREVFRGRQGGAARLVISPDGRTLYHRRPVPANQPPHDLVARDLQTGKETVLLSQVPLGALQLSPDGRFIVTPSNDAAKKTNRLLLVPTGGGQPRELKIDDGALPNLIAFAPDSKSMIGFRNVKGTAEYWWIPFDERRPRQLEMPSMERPMRGVQVSPDGKTVVFELFTPRPTSGVWIMDFERRAVK